MTRTQDRYVPAFLFSWLAPVYDPLIRWTMRERAFKGRLVEEARIAPGHRVLDLGCGTGTLVLLVKAREPGAEVVGIDGDPTVLAIARAKTAKGGARVTLDLGLASALPYPDASFDRVLSTLVLHHLTSDGKRRATAESLRVLRPGGELHVADWGRSRSRALRLAFFAVRAIDGFARTEENARGLLPRLFRDGGFENVATIASYAVPFGAVVLYRAQKPAPAGAGASSSSSSDVITHD